MFIVKLWHYIRGYVIINIKGRHLERLINLIHHNDILIWDIVGKGTDKLTAKIELSDYSRVVELADQLSCQVEIVKKSGMTLWKWRVQSRKIFVVASIIALIGLYLMSSLVLTVDITGDFSGQKEDIEEYLADRGLRPWKLKGAIDLDKIKSSFLNDYEGFEYIDIEFSGTKAIVDLVEEEEVESIYDKSIPLDLTAKKDAIITDILIVNGTANVEVNQEVEEGDLLVRGEVMSTKLNDEGEEEIFKNPIRAKAKVMGLVGYEEKIHIRKYKVLDEEAYKINRVLHIGDLVINFPQKDENYYYDSSEEVDLHLFDFKLPIKMNKIKYYEKENCVNKTQEELLQEVEDKIEKKFREIGQIQNTEVLSVREENKINEYQVRVSVVEEISQEQLLDE